jgi:hypothetical protein
MRVRIRNAPSIVEDGGPMSHTPRPPPSPQFKIMEPADDSVQDSNANEEELLLEKMIKAAEDAANEAAAAVLAEEAEEEIALAADDNTETTTTTTTTTTTVALDTDAATEIKQETEQETDNVSRKRARSSDDVEEEDEEGDKVLDEESNKSADPTSTKRARVEEVSVADPSDSGSTTSSTTVDPVDPVDPVNLSTASNTTPETNNATTISSQPLGFHNAGGFADFVSAGGGGGSGSGFGGGFGSSSSSSSSSGFGAPAAITTEGFAAFGSDSTNDFSSGSFAVFGSGDVKSGSGGFGSGGSDSIGGGGGGGGGGRASPTPSDVGSVDGSMENIAEQHVASPSAADSAAVCAQLNGEENETNVIDPVRVKVYQMGKNEKVVGEGEGATEGKDKKEEKEAKPEQEEQEEKPIKDEDKKEVTQSTEEHVQWSCLGVGELRLKEMKDTQSSSVPKQRIVMRREYGASTHAGDLKLNLAITQYMNCEIVQEKNLRLTTLEINAVPGAPTVSNGTQTFLIRVKTIKDAQTLGKKIQQHIVRCKNK